MGCTSFLSHQSKTPNVARTLNMHLRNETEIIRFGGDRASRVATMRANLIGRRTWVIPIGGSSWLGTLGFVNAGLELAEQAQSGDFPVPARLYVATGTMGTAAGIALGLALRGMPTVVHAVRVSHESICNTTALQRLMRKTAMLMNRFDPAIPADLASRTNVVLRNDFFADGYAQSNEATHQAISLARDEFGIALEQTYTGKAMAALLQDINSARVATQPMLFWNTYNSRSLPAGNERPDDIAGIPEQFLRYYD
jgi:D-cysteine desulfhydrase